MPIEWVKGFVDDVVARLKDPRGYCLCCSLDAAHWPVEERFRWMRLLCNAKPCAQCPSRAMGAPATLARRRFAWLALETELQVRAAERRRDREGTWKEPLRLEGRIRPMPGDPQPEFWTQRESHDNG